jgi:hypothetical protein
MRGRPGAFSGAASLALTAGTFMPELKLSVILSTALLIIMLIKFDSEAGSFTMNGDVAVQLLRAMGHSGTVPSAILPADIPAALARLKIAVAETAQAAPDVAAGDDKRAKEAPVSLRQRAFPLIDLLTRAAERGAEVMWK